MRVVRGKRDASTRLDPELSEKGKRDVFGTRREGCAPALSWTDRVESHTADSDDERAHPPHRLLPLTHHGPQLELLYSFPFAYRSG